MSCSMLWPQDERRRRKWRRRERPADRAICHCKRKIHTHTHRCGAGTSADGPIKSRDQRKGFPSKVELKPLTCKFSFAPSHLSVLVESELNTRRTQDSYIAVRKCPWVLNSPLYKLNFFYCRLPATGTCWPHPGRHTCTHWWSSSQLDGVKPIQIICIQTPLPVLCISSLLAFAVCLLGPRDFLPRGSGIVTRRPLVLQLMNCPTGTNTPHINICAVLFFCCLPGCFELVLSDLLQL